MQGPSAFHKCPGVDTQLVDACDCVRFLGLCFLIEKMMARSARRNF